MNGPYIPPTFVNFSQIKTRNGKFRQIFALKAHWQENIEVQEPKMKLWLHFAQTLGFFLVENRPEMHLLRNLAVF